MNDDPADLDLYKSEYDARADVPIQRSRSPLLLAVAVLFGLALGGAYLYLRAPARQPAPAAARPVQHVESAPPGERTEQISLPPLDESDPLVRQLVERLSSHPVVAAWMTTDGLILNFTAVTLMISNGESPAQELREVVRVPAFRPRTLRDDLFIAPSSYQRYDRYADAVAVLDARGAARLYSTLKPRIHDAYRRMGSSTGDFDPVLERAIVELLHVPIVTGDIELAPHGIGYAFVDPRLEGLSPAQKHLLRMGPKNIQAIQSKLREIADYLAIPAARLR